MMTSSYEEDIKEAIWIILMTKKGERIRNPEFGCSIHEYVFDSLNYQTISQMQRSVEEALLLWEPRIMKVEVTVTIPKDKEGLVNIEVAYVVRATNNPFNLVFPFYMNEGYGKNAE
ncbi:MAG: GPW/gp25 family protein [Clostridium sp.]|nr:GPW/gp25 family protein [Clostridium sp.]